MRFVAGILRNLPTLHDLPPATVTIDLAATPHLATYDLVLPRERGLLSRARRVLRLAAGAAAALDELEQQATEIASQNQALARQLTETERAASELREREAWLGLALDAGRVGLWRWDPDTRRVWISEGLGQILGLPGDVEIETAIWTERIHPDDRARVAATMTDAIARGAPCQMEYRLVRPTGELSWVQTKGRAVPGAGGRTFQMFGTLADLSEQRLVDARLRSADRLIAAGTLAAGVAHEINNPLTYVLGNVDLIRMRLGDTASLTPAMLESLAQVREGLGRIRDVVADLRAFARPEQEQLVRVDVRTVADAAIRLVSSVVRHQAAVTTDYDADTPTVLVNESRLGQVLINLIVNASHAMPERPTSANSIVVRTRRRPSGEAAIEVVDNGSGIAPDLLPRLFDPFFTTKAPGEGTGLGLSVCQSIVTSMRSRIDIESTLGHGTTFAVVLPPARRRSRSRSSRVRRRRPRHRRPRRSPPTVAPRPTPATGLDHRRRARGPAGRGQHARRPGASPWSRPAGGRPGSTTRSRPSSTRSSAT
ncbi:MAG: PAS domain-containing protein [Myxococcales bacterium]|nr:PAS domain-containing protein [Myxococcales bacterium]